MKRRLTFISAAFWLSAAFTFVACGGNDDESNNAAGITPDGKVDVTRAVEFKVNFGDYNSEEEVQGTRAAKTEGSDTLSREFVELGNGLLAEVTVQKDMEKTQVREQCPVTRSLDDGTYTMLVYKDGVLQGEMSGTVSSGVFTATRSNKDIALTPDTYDFVLFNSKVSRSGNNLTVSRADVETALIGRTTYAVTATPIKQKVAFNMKHAGSRMRIKLTGYMPFTTSATLSSIDANSIPNTAVYNAATDAWSNGTGTATSARLTFPTSKEETYPDKGIYVATSNEYQYFLPSTNPSKLKFKFASGSIYNQSMTGAPEQTLFVPTLPTMAANASYVINIKLLYSFLYLMNDGTTGTLKDTKYGSGTKIPIGVVVSRSKRLAIALKNANGGAYCQWYKEISNKQQNNRNFNTADVSVFNDMDGYRYTWYASGSADNRTIKGNELTDFPAFYHAGHYGDEVAAEVAAQGKVLSGGIETKKWHLPSAGEWINTFTALGFGNKSSLTSFYPFYDWPSYELVNITFTSVGGTALQNEDTYWSSSEMHINYAPWILLREYMSWGHASKHSLSKVRAFIIY